MNAIIIESLKEKIDLTADFFYKQKSKEGYQVLISAIDALMAITAELKAAQDNENTLEFHQKLAVKLQEITEAMLQKDTILIADMMKYDIMELLDELAEIEI